MENKINESMEKNLLKFTNDFFLNEYAYASVLTDVDPILKNNINFFKFLQRQIPRKEVRKFERFPHITIIYGIDNKVTLNKINNFINTYIKNKNIEITLGPINFFRNNEKYNVIYVEVISEELLKLHELLKKNIKNFYSYDKYIPHITLAYIRPRSLEYLRGCHYFVGQKIKIDKLIFSTKDEEKIYIKL